MPSSSSPTTIDAAAGVVRRRDRAERRDRVERPHEAVARPTCARSSDERDRAGDHQQRQRAEQHRQAPDELPQLRALAPRADSVASVSRGRRSLTPLRSGPARRIGSVVVGLAGEDLVAAVELLEQHDAGELVGQRDRAEREAVVDASQLEPERAADHEAEVAAARRAAARGTAERSESIVSPPASSSDTNARSGSRRGDLRRPRAPRSARAARARPAASVMRTSSTNGGRSRPTATTMIRTVGY